MEENNPDIVVITAGVNLWRKVTKNMYLSGAIAGRKGDNPFRVDFVIRAMHPPQAEAPVEVKVLLADEEDGIAKFEAEIYPDKINARLNGAPVEVPPAYAKYAYTNPLFSMFLEALAQFNKEEAHEVDFEVVGDMSEENIAVLAPFLYVLATQDYKSLLVWNTKPADVVVRSVDGTYFFNITDGTLTAYADGSVVINAVEVNHVHLRASFYRNVPKSTLQKTKYFPIQSSIFTSTAGE